MKDKKMEPKPQKLKKVVARVKPELISYSIKMVIPTAPFANIQPQIVVKAGTVEEAHDFIAPHMNKLWKEYFMINERRAEVAPVAPVVPTPVNIQPVIADSPVSSVAFTKASQAIASCLGLDAFNLIVNQVNASVKLTDEDKEKLGPVLEAKYNELNGKQ
jgi:hypothetical protein